MAAVNVKLVLITLPTVLSRDEGGSFQSLEFLLPMYRTAQGCVWLVMKSATG